MQLRIREHGVEIAREARDAIERKLRFALGRHSAAVERVHATLARSGSETEEVRCRIRLRLRGGGILAVEDLGRDPFEASESAVWRISHRLERPRRAQPGTLAAPRRLGHR